jgi:hypothetical protein
MAGFAAFSPFASHLGMTKSGRLFPFPLQSLPGFNWLLKGKYPP